LIDPAGKDNYVDTREEIMMRKSEQKLLIGIVLCVLTLMGCGKDSTLTAPSGSTIAISPTTITATIAADSKWDISVSVTDADGKPVNGAKVYITGAFAVPRTLPRYQFYSRIGGVNPVNSGFRGTTDANGVYSFSIKVYTGAAFTDSINISSGSVSESMTLTFT
jgi:hypothetical protein